MNYFTAGLFTIASILTLLPSASIAQSSFSDYKPGHREYILFDGFENNNNEWEIYNHQDAQKKIEEGNMYFRSKNNETKLTKINVDIDISRNFEIESRFKVSENPDGYVGGLSWHNDKDEKYVFGTNAKTSYYCFFSKSSGHYDNILDWTKTDIIKAGEYNTFMVRKVSNTYYFFINEKYITSKYIPDFNIKKVGLQVSRNSSIYFDYLSVSYINKKAPSYGETVFYEDFSNNNNDWSERETDEIAFDVSEGYYYFNHKRSTGSWGSYKTIDLDETQDFIIESSIKKISGIENNRISLLFGREDWDNQLKFAYASNGYFIIEKEDNGEDVDVYPWTITSRVNTGNYSTNKLTVKKEEDHLFYYINDYLVGTEYFKGFYGKRIGWGLSQNQKIAIDYLKVKYVKKGSAMHLAQQNTAQNQQTDGFVSGLPPILTISDITFSENVLNAEETATLSVTLSNTGPGDAKNVSLNLSGYLQDLKFPAKTTFPTISSNGGSQTLNVAVKGGIDLPTAEATLKIEVVEPNFKVKIQGKQLTFPTEEFKKPQLILAQYALIENQSSSPNNQIDINEMIDFKFAIQNIGQGNAENLNISVTCNQTGVMLLGVADGSQLIRQNPKITLLESGKYETVTYRYFVNSEFVANNLEFSVTATERTGKHGMVESKSFPINTQLEAAGFIRTVTNNTNKVEQKVIIEDIPDFVSDVDKNIPSSASINEKTFALIIGNEKYTNEIKVDYALNDARMMKQYMQKTLGVPKNNIHYLENATYGQVLGALNWIGDVAKAYEGQSKVIFYYAGHGMPDEKSKDAFILPVDGNSSNVATAVPLSRIYNTLSEHPTKSTTVFLDACFSGAARNASSDMLAQGRGVKITPKKSALSGNLVVFSAATGDQTAFPYKDKQHGMFTYYLLKKLQQTKGETSLNDLESYIRTKVSQQSIVVNKKSQTPQVNTSTAVSSSWKNQTLK